MTVSARLVCGDVWYSITHLAATDDAIEFRVGASPHRDGDRIPKHAPTVRRIGRGFSRTIDLSPYPKIVVHFETAPGDYLDYSIDSPVTTIDPDVDVLTLRFDSTTGPLSSRLLRAVADEIRLGT